MTFVRGKGNYVPFRPGGLDDGAFAGDAQGDGEGEETEEERAVREKEEEEAMGKTWKTIAPGMRRGLKLDGGGSAVCVGFSGAKGSRLGIVADEFLRSVLGEASFTAPVKRRKRPKQQIGVSNTDMQDGAMDENMAVRSGSHERIFTDCLDRWSGRKGRQRTRSEAKSMISFQSL